MVKPGKAGATAQKTIAQKEQGALSVSAFMAGLHHLVKDQVGRVWVQGEISNFMRAASGHCYFTLKDRKAQVRAVLFRGAAGNLRFEPENGLEVLVLADAAVYEQRGELQLVVRRLEPQGQGALQLAFEQLKARLSEEGLFDADGKQPLPAMPRGIGIVASKHSAALRDVLQVSGRRFPQIPVVIAHSAVQGKSAEQELVQALHDLAQRPELDVLLVVRGGGSLEDLWSFNTEGVARAIAACPLPVVSGVGHEVDVTIADLVADLRAPTPSAAAELVWPSGEECQRRVQREWEKLTGAMQGVIEGLTQDLDVRNEALRAHSPVGRLRLQQERFAHQAQRLQSSIRAHYQEARSGFVTQASRLDSLSPLAVLERGYAVVRRDPEGQVLRRAADVAPGEALNVRLSEGSLRARVEEVFSSGSAPGSSGSESRPEVIEK